METTKHESNAEPQSRKGGVMRRFIWIAQIIGMVIVLKLSDWNWWMVLVYPILCGTHYLEGYLKGKSNAS